MNALELHNVTKRFGEKVIANDHVSLTVRRGEILAVLGENGSGKTTLMNMIAGIYHPDEGEIHVNGQPVTISSPRDAFRCGIGMVHQHFKLVDVFTATENIVLGVEDGKPYRLKEATRRVEEISARYGFEIDAKKKIYAMSVSEKQTVEIVKVLYRGAEILILDEPTAVLTPQETEKLFAVLRRMREDGKSIVIITHKLNEVLSLSDRVTVLHKGKNAGTVNTAETNEAQLTEMMVGQKVVLNIERKMPENPEDRLVVKDVSCLSRDGVQLLDRVTFTARAGEILGIAGISGNGQRELAEAIYGARKLQSGILSANEEDISSTDIAHRIRLGMRMVTEDPIRDNVVPTFSILENMALVGLDPIYRHGDMDWQAMRSQLQTHSEVKTLRVPQAERIAGTLSGGNLQRMAFARAVISRPRLLIASYPSRGLDIATVHAVHKTLFRLKKQGVGTILISEDISELFTMCDRILVLSSHTAFGPYCVDACTPNEIGKIMLQGENAHE